MKHEKYHYRKWRLPLAQGSGFEPEHCEKEEMYMPNCPNEDFRGMNNGTKT
jgi:hypothetical protein